MSDAELLLLAESKKKSGWIAALLNLFIPGLGYMYCGMWILGLFVLVLAIVIGVVTLGTGLVILYPIIFIDGFLGAGRANKKMIEKLIKDRASIQRAQAAAT
jgi:hypothetical protein